MISKEIEDKYRKILKNRVFNQFDSIIEFSEASGISGSHISKFLSGKSGFSITTMDRAFATVGLKLKLVPRKKAKADTPETWSDEIEFRPQRKLIQQQRLIRNSKYASWVKKAYQYKCQICGTSLTGPLGKYAEAAHIRPLGGIHKGPDSRANILCLCPNHHTLLDGFAFWIDEDFRLVGLKGKLRVNDQHKISNKHLKYHRDLCISIRNRDS